METLFNGISLHPQMMLYSSNETLHEAGFDQFQSLTPFYGRRDGEFEISKLLESFVTQDFAVFLAAYYMYYLCVAGLLTAVAVFIFKIDYTDIDSKQLKREVLLTLESYTTSVLIGWIMLQSVPFSSDIDLFGIATSYVINLSVFNCWFYFSHRMWHSNRIIYKYVHEHHHRSTIVCPLTALSNSWLESVWAAVGFAIGPLFLGPIGANNVWGWYMAIASIFFFALLGHSRLPYTLEHATHHTTVNKNFGFYFILSPKVGLMSWDSAFGTWAFAADVPKVKKVYPKESTLYTWDKNECAIRWENIDQGKSVSSKLE
jgi:sterol desaturase/sphingolipid hydroxylase (fatty acid hydroxylase superfamily)